MRDHPISLDQAFNLMKGDLGNVYREILSKSCCPIFWYRTDISPIKVEHNGTLTILQTPKKIIAITAAHVVRQFQKDIQENIFRLQLMNEVCDNFMSLVIDISDKRDLATIELSQDILSRLGKTPINWPLIPPEEGKGIMLSGFPNIELIENVREPSWGLFTALGVARTVTLDQITWLIEPEHNVPNPKIPTPPPLYDLGGISGGPLISWFESEQNVVHYRLSGIITEHPSYKENLDFPPIERLVASRADCISENGMIIF